MSDHAERDQLIAELPPMTDIIRGSLLKYYHEGCRCHPKGRYGPYWYLSVKLQGRTKMRKLQDHQVPHVRAAIANYKRWWEACLKIIELNTQAALARED